MSPEKQPAQVMLVEDSAGDALLTGQIVAESSLPIKLVIARDGVQALVMLADPAFQPALIILDLNIPLISGHIVLERNQRKDIPVVIFSVSSDENEARRALALGAREYVQKPTDLDAYKQAVLRMITKWTGSDESAVERASAN
jgi:two-component system, chemotaxis family, response regulator Rcp1